MDFQIDAAMRMISELYYQKRVLEDELATVREQALRLLSEQESMTVKMAVLEAQVNGQPKKKAGKIEND
jgi:hypothetical protein